MTIPTNTLKSYAKLFFSIVILAVLFHQIHIKELLPYLKKMNIAIFILAISVLLCGNVVAIYRWSLVMRTLGAPRATGFYFRTYLIGMMFNQILPSSIGGDGYRMLEATKLNLTKSMAITSVLADRIIGFTGLVLMSALSLPTAYRILPVTVFHLVACIIGLCCCTILGVFCLRHIRIRLFETYLSWFYHISKTLSSATTSAGDLLAKIGMGLLTNLLSALSYYFIARSLGISCHPLDFIIVIPLVTLLMMIPISMAGWGIREGAMVYFGAMIGLNHPAALAISLLSGLILIINSLPGLYLYSHNKSITVSPAPIEN